MSACVPLWNDLRDDDRRGLASGSRNAGQSCRLLALTTIDDGASRGDAARTEVGGVQTVREWVSVFNAAGPHGLIHRKAQS